MKRLSKSLVLLAATAVVTAATADATYAARGGSKPPKAAKTSKFAATTKNGEIVDVQEADQFQKGKTQYACGYFACAVARSMARPNEPPILTRAEVIADGLKYYREYDGSDAITNTNGMTDAQLWSLLHEIGLHYQQTSTEASVLKNWLRTGYPVIVTVNEVSVDDIALGKNPYTSWTPSGTHMFLLTGLSSRGNFLARDSANCTSLDNPDSLRPGPREYDAAKLQVVSATVVVPPWMRRPASATPPAGEATARRRVLSHRPAAR